MPKDFTIIVPVYNIRNEYILDCYNSLKNINYNKDLYEVLFIDDGSTDDSREYIFQLIKNDSEMKLYYQENQGVSVARNHGIERSNGNYILFLDPDDWIESDLLKELNAKIRSEPDLILFSHTEEYKNYRKSCFINNQVSKNSLSKREIEELKRNLIDITRKTNYSYDYKIFGAVWGKCYKKSKIFNNNIKFDKELRKAQDTAFNLKYLNTSEKIIILDKTLYHYRMVNTSITHRFNPQIINIQNIFLKKIEEIIIPFQTPQIEEAFLHRIFSSYLNILDLYTFHPENKQKYKDKKRDWKKLVSNKYFKQIKKVDSTKYSFGIKMILLLTKKEIFFPLTLLYKIKKQKIKLSNEKLSLYE